MIFVTGGAGFIGSAIIHQLNQQNTDDILVVDQLDHPAKNKNLAKLKFRVIMDKEVFLEKIKSRSLPAATAIIHMGACSSTTETDVEFLRTNNFLYSRELATYALEKGIRFVYASSAATYGSGEKGYADDETMLASLTPLNPYGDSKQQFDLWAKEQRVLDKIVGLKYFNVYGPNEYHKGDMQSMVRKGFLQIKDTGKIRLYKSYKTEFGDGGQERDFLYVRDAVAITLFFLEKKEGGLFNVGSGRARNWNDLAHALFSAMEMEPRIEYIDMPEPVRRHYQYYTCAELEKLRKAGYNRPMVSLEEGVSEYVKTYLMKDNHLGDEQGP